MRVSLESPISFGDPSGVATEAQRVSLEGDGTSQATSPGKAKANDSSASGGAQDTVTLSPDAQREVTQLKQRDQEVRAHEAAHMAAGGGIVTGGATYTYQQGPDGRRYAVGGEVSIDSSPVANNPRATENKAWQIQSAALAPANPSPQDRKVAAQAARMAAKAAVELQTQAEPGRGVRFESIV